MKRLHRIACSLSKPDLEVTKDILKAGLFSIQPINKTISKRVLSMLYSPGVGAPCMKIKDDPQMADQLTLRGRSVAIVSDGSALGCSGPNFAAVMDWMVIQLKFYAGIDSFPFLIRETANIGSILADLSTCYGTVLYLDSK